MSSKFMPSDLARQALLTVLPNLAEWPIPSAAAFRNAVLSGAAFAISPLLALDEEQDVLMIQTILQGTVESGCMIDFGLVPNAVLMAESVRAREVFENGELIHPYENWLGVMPWEGGCTAYLVTCAPGDPRHVVVFELYGARLPRMGETTDLDLILVYDIVSLYVPGNGQTIVRAINSTAEGQNRPAELTKRGANSLDPLVCMLRFLADGAIPVTRVAAPDKLNRQRSKTGRHMIPPHTVVHTSSYVTALRAHAKARSEDKGGTHASPHAHWRRAHKRVLASGSVVPVRSSKVNWRNAAELHRQFYKLGE